MSMILPTDVLPASPDILKAVRAASFVALTNAEPPLDFYVDYGDIMGELNRRLQPTEETRFRPIFNRHFASLYPDLTSAFPSCSETSTMRQLVSTFMVSIGLRAQITYPGVRSMCHIISTLLSLLWSSRLHWSRARTISACPS